MIELDPRSTALVLIDLQKGVLARELARPASEVLSSAIQIAERFRAVSAPVVLVRVQFASDLSDSLRQPVDSPFVRAPGTLGPEFSEFGPGLFHAGDILVTKRQWGAFYGTDLELLLRRRGIKTIVLGGIATNFGVESTARDAWEQGFEVVFIEDVMTSLSVEMHEFPIRHVFPRIGRLARTDSISFKSA